MSAPASHPIDGIPDGAPRRIGGVPLRARFRIFVERHEVAWELAFALLAVIYIAIGFVEDDMVASQRAPLEVAEIALTAIFAVEYVSRLWAARNRVSHAVEHWTDLVALVPAVRGARILRLFRLLRLIRVFSGFYRAVDRVPRLARHTDFIRLFLSWIAIGVICSVSLLAAERDAPGAAITSMGDALWWGVGALTTVGTELQPSTFEGRIAAMAAMLVGVFLFSGVTATITSYLVREDAPAPRDGAAQLAELWRLRNEGGLTDDEFASAKARVLAASGDAV